MSCLATGTKFGARLVYSQGWPLRTTTQPSTRRRRTGGTSVDDAVHDGWTSIRIGIRRRVRHILFDAPRNSPHGRMDITWRQPPETGPHATTDRVGWLRTRGSGEKQRGGDSAAEANSGAQTAVRHVSHRANHRKQARCDSAVREHTVTYPLCKISCLCVPARNPGVLCVEDPSPPPSRAHDNGKAGLSPNAGVFRIARL
jgi:hypothetical protein